MTNEKNRSDRFPWRIDVPENVGKREKLRKDCTPHKKPKKVTLKEVLTKYEAAVLAQYKEN